MSSPGAQPARGPSLHLDPEQHRFVHAAARLIVLTAPPGTGKTTSLAARFEHAVAERGVEPTRIAVATFTRRAADAFRRALARSSIAAQVQGRLTPAPAFQDATELTQLPALWVGTFHDLCSRILRAHTPLIARNAPLRTISPRETRMRLAHALEETGNMPRPPGEREGAITTAERALEKIKSKARDPRDTVRAWDRISAPKHLVDTLALYQQRLQRDNALDIADLLCETHHLLAREPLVAHAWQQRFCEWMVDECQDSDAVSIAILRKLAPQARVVLCGDPDQSIYSWRNAPRSVAPVIGAFSPTHGAPEHHVLRHDYRIPRAVQHCANALRRHISDCGPPPHPSGPARWSAPVYLRIESEHDTGATLAHLIDAILASPDAAPDPERGEPASSPNDFIVLTRTNADAARVARALAAHGKPVHLRMPAEATAAGNALISVCQALSEPHDDARLAQALCAEPWRVAPQTLGALRAQAIAQRTSLYVRLNTATLPEELIEAVEAFNALREQCEQARSAAEIVEAVERRCALIAVASADGERALRAYQHLRSLAISAPNPHFAAQYAIAHASDDTPVPAQAVQIATMHSVKGEEHRHVIAHDWSEGEFPSSYTRNLQEERRLAFVTITRTRRTFTALAYATDKTGRRTTPSRFLVEATIPKHQLKRAPNYT